MQTEKDAEVQGETQCLAFSKTKQTVKKKPFQQGAQTTLRLQGNALPSKAPEHLL